MLPRIRRPHVQSAAAAATAMIEMLEKRQHLDATAIESRISVRQVADSEGVLVNQSNIKVPFDNTIELVDADNLRIRGYAIDPSTGEQKKLVINITSASVQADNQTLALTTDRMVPKGARIYIDAGALTDTDGGAVTPQIVRTPRGLSKIAFTFASRAFKVNDFDGFLPSIFPAADAPTTADDVQTDEAAIEADLTDFLEKKVAAATITQAEMDAAIARYNNSVDADRIPDHNLRAALLSLVGTFAEQAIAVYLDGENLTGEPYTVVAFAETDPEAVIADTEETDTGRLRTRVKPQFAGEPFQALSAILAHEALHQDNSTGLKEELIATTFEAMVWAEQVDIDEAPSNSGTALVADQNTKLLALLNSGMASFPNLGTKDAPLVNDLGVFYGAAAQTGGQYTSFDNFIRRQYVARGAVDQESPGNPTLGIYMTALDAGAVTTPFSEAIVDTLDERMATVLDHEQALRVAGDLGLRV
jgi:hypothetical protein